MTTFDITATTAIVTGAGRGFGRGVATALVGAGAHVIGVARGAGQLADVGAQLGARFTPVCADAADAATAAHLIDRYHPGVVVLAAGAAPRMGRLTEQTWESFSENWNVDVAQAFHWIRQALQRPLAPGSTVIAFSSGAALNGSPLSGGYAGAKATVRFIADYGAGESEQSGFGINVVSVLPQLTPATDLGFAAVAAYAAAAGVDPDTFVARRGAVLTPEQAGKAILEILTAPQHRSYGLGAEGLIQLP
ncbi:SDR family oxidoreductase [Mycolicibacterium brisbanense]|uniref:Short-chain dehydrogenase/reductase SDR n=1 Tax=Mycolicibacterium brisbanense TaxID=146020 RepID=A0A100W6F1_9MYCO|nr:SDR family oxidoreductase [Mycolicibacterium brisbanense]MCV7157839.1 SDR family oxidoreductase [Mycolicibacterium brisbanense]GAS92483.1 short-chain dehydrogenase/reductase SDR [Mycolicibacterium brisbanense]